MQIPFLASLNRYALAVTIYVQTIAAYLTLVVDTGKYQILSVIDNTSK